MILRPPRSTLPDPLFPYTTLFRSVPFVDAGNAYESTFPKGSDLRFGAGIGARYYTNFGPLRIDVATPLNPRPRSEEHTSELQSLMRISYAVFCLKKKNYDT